MIRRLTGVSPRDCSCLARSRMALKAWRTELARDVGLPAYTILHDKTLHALAALRPKTTAELLTVPGIGPSNCEKYGAVLLGVMGESSPRA